MDGVQILMGILTIAALVLAAIVFLFVMILRGKKEERTQKEFLEIRTQLETGTRANSEYNAALRKEITENLREGMKTQSEQLLSSSKLQTETLLSMSEKQDASLQKIMRENAQMKEAIVEALVSSMEKIRASNEQKLNEMQGIVDRKLEKTLNERLDANFSRVTEQLGKLYRSLGELKDLSSGVSDLNHTLSNVKTRGIWGEMQLSRILSDTMARGQYEENVATKAGSRDRVEFAVKFPSQDGSADTVYLPIDAKFPSDIYNRIVDASEAGDPAALSAATSELRARIRDEANTIAAKYLDPPRTTNFAFLYLPTEGLYSEALRIDGLSEECQKKGVVLTGPTTITAVLNSLQVGFRNIALSKKSVEVMHLLEAVKGQVTRMNDEVEKTQKKLTEAASLTEGLHRRTWHISNKMKAIGSMEEADADRMLEISKETDPPQ